uniref:Uncharacterized protein n=1 Tax=Octopus bimaculoides TaxID=37653 RepID=A0A0L8I812_OCTBM
MFFFQMTELINCIKTGHVQYIFHLLGDKTSKVYSARDKIRCIIYLQMSVYIFAYVRMRNVCGLTCVFACTCIKVDN